MNNTTEVNKYQDMPSKLILALLYGFAIMFFVFKPQSASDIIILIGYIYVCQMTTLIPFFFKKFPFIDKKDIALIIPACVSLCMFAIFCLQYPMQIAIANMLAMASTQLAVMTFCFYRWEILEGQ